MINGFNATSAATIAPTFVSSATPSYSISGNTLTGSGASANQGSGSGAGTVSVVFPSPVTSFTLVFKDGPLAKANPEAHGIALLSSVSFDSVPPTTDDATIPITAASTNLTGLGGDGGRGRDILRGGLNQDKLLGRQKGDWLNGGRGDDWLIGGNGKDVLIGKQNRDTLLGGAQADRLLGRLGHDVLIGRMGDDVLISSRGRDVLNGGLGSDRFVYQTVKDGGDRITQFERTDFIDLQQIFAQPTYTRSRPFNRYIKLSSTGSSTVVQVDANGDALGGFQPLVTLQNTTIDQVNFNQFIVR